MFGLVPFHNCDGTSEQIEEDYVFFNMNVGESGSILEMGVNNFEGSISGNVR